MSLKCDNCGAPLPKGTTSGEMTCTHCGHRYKLVAPVAPAPQVDAEAARRAAQREVALQHRAHAIAAAAAAGRTGRSISIVVSLVVMAMVAGGVFFAVKAKRGGLGAVFSMDFLIWDDVGGRPVVVTVGGREAVLGRVRTPAAGDKLFIRLSATDGGEIWRTPALSTYMEGYQSTYYAAAGEHAVFSDYRSQLHIVDLATGKEQRLVSLTDRVKEICAVDANQVWVKQADDRQLRVDVNTGETQEASRPGSCPKRDSWGKLESEEPGRAPKVPGFRADRVNTGDGVAVASGVKSPGTPLPMIVGFDPASREVRWKQPLATIDQNKVRDGSAELSAVHGDRYVATYGEGSDLWHLTALDARTGDRQWDVVLRNVFAVDWIRGLIVTEGHVYLTRTSSLEILDASNGRLLGTIGRETYE